MEKLIRGWLMASVALPLVASRRAIAVFKLTVVIYDPPILMPKHSAGEAPGDAEEGGVQSGLAKGFAYKRGAAF